MKTLNQVLEQYEPSPGNKKFIAKLGMNKVADRNGNGDEVFKASNVKSYERTAVRHGYEAGEDEKVYEEVEDLDELSKRTLGRYVRRAAHDLGSNAESSGYYDGRDAERRTNNSGGRASIKYANMANRRLHGIETAAKKLAKEEVEQIDELSKDTLSSYSNKSIAQLKSFAGKRGRKSAADKATINKREVGKNRAYGKLSAISRAESEKRWNERAANAKTSNENFSKAVQTAAQGRGYHHISSSPHKDVYLKTHSNGAVNLLIHNKPPVNGDHSFNTPDIRVLNSSGASWSSHAARSTSFRDEAPTSKDVHLSGIHHYLGEAEKRTIDDHHRELEYHKRDR